jgi:TonB family protein
MRFWRLVYAVILLAVSCTLTGNVQSQESRRAIFKRAPAYPEIARKMSLSGTVKIEITVGADGKVKHANVIGGHPVLVAPALEAVKSWEYEPTRTESTITVQIDFRP